MKVFKKISCLLLAGALLFNFAACSSGDDGGSSGGNNGGGNPGTSSALAAFKGELSGEEVTIYFQKDEIAVWQQGNVSIKGTYTGDITKNGEGTTHFSVDSHDLDYGWKLNGDSLALTYNVSGYNVSFATFTRVSGSNSDSSSKENTETSTDEKSKSDSSKTDEKDTNPVPKTPVTKSDPSSKNYPFSGTTWVKQGDSSYKFVFSEDTYKFSFGGMAYNMGYTVEKNGEAYIAQAKMNETIIKVESADATTATVTRTVADMNTYKQTKVTETYIRQ